MAPVYKIEVSYSHTFGGPQHLPHLMNLITNADQLALLCWPHPIHLVLVNYTYH